MNKLLLIPILLLFLQTCKNPSLADSSTSKIESKPSTSALNIPFVWQNASVYFMLTDRFNNGDKSNDVNFDRTLETDKLRNFMGGDIKGITQKIDEGYFTDLGVNAIWFTPIMEQIHGSVNEGTGNTYGFHGYWIKDWTSMDPNFGTEKDLQELVEKAHAKGIRVILDVVINHTGPVTAKDPLWKDWARISPQCTYKDFETTVSCTLVKNLPDIYTERDEAVELPQFLLDKWEAEGRKDKELKELDEFFAATGYPRSPRHYIIKWLVDLIKKYGVDGFRVDTVKHTEPYVWKELREEAVRAFNTWKAENPGKVLDDNEFYLVGEVYGYGISGGQLYDYGDKKVNFFEDAFTSMINFEFKYDAQKDYEAIFSKYSKRLNEDLKGKSVLNYLSSHDDGSPFDQNRKKAIEAGTKLLLSPGGVQIYYGDESGRTLTAEGNGDAVLRSFMNWEEIENNTERGGHKAKEVLAHWQKLGTFRNNHPSVGAGFHTLISKSPYVFQRSFAKGAYTDKVVIGLKLAKGTKTISVGDAFGNGTKLRDAYSGKTATVETGKVVIDTPYDIVLLEN